MNPTEKRLGERRERSAMGRQRGGRGLPREAVEKVDAGWGGP